MTDPGFDMGGQGSLLERSMDLDGFLDMELPELQEFVPVDSFFNDYVSGLELGAQDQQLMAQNAFASGQGMAPQGGLLPFSGGLYPDRTAQKDTPANAGLNGNNRQHASMASLNGMYPGSGSPQAPPLEPILLEAPAAYTGAAAMMPPIITTGEVPLVPTPSDSGELLGRAPSKRGRPRGSGRGGRRKSVAARSDSSGSGEGTMLHHTERGGDKTKRNPKQQLQNKQAQQRYRERRKERFSELEATLDQMDLQLQGERTENADLAARNQALQSRAEQLESLLAEKEAELKALCSSLREPSGAPLPEDGGLDAPAAAVPEVKSTPSGPLNDEEAAAIQSCFTSHVSEVRQFIDEHNLRMASPLGDGMDPAIMAHLKMLVESGWQNVQRAVLAGGIKVLDLMGRDAEAMGKMTCQRKQARWVRILESVRLTPSQQEALLQLRQQHLAKLHEVYAKRQSLNMHAMSLMLPQPGTMKCETVEDFRGDSTLDGKMACMSISGYAACAKSNVDLDAVLGAIKENLRLEQKTVMQMQFMVMFRLLSPLQNSLFLVEAYPTRPDALALSNICSQALGRGGEGCPKAAEFLARQNQRRQQESAAAQIEALVQGPPCGGTAQLSIEQSPQCGGCSRQASCARLVEYREERASADSIQSHSSDIYSPP